MSSKLIPKSESTGIAPFSYRTVANSQAAPPGFAPGSATPAVTDTKPELDALRARLAELERALPQQVAVARQAGAREGEAKGRTQAEANLKPVVERLTRSIAEVAEWKPRLRKEVEEDAALLALAIARRILRRELSIDPAALQALVQVAFEKVARKEVTRVITHPEHVTALRESLAQLTTRQIEIAADGSHEKGTLIFETTRGALDASIDSQLREIELGLSDRLKWR